jgi:hypothetical protein
MDRHSQRTPSARDAGIARELTAGSDVVETYSCTLTAPLH